MVKDDDREGKSRVSGLCGEREMMILMISKRKRNDNREGRGRGKRYASERDSSATKRARDKRVWSSYKHSEKRWKMEGDM